ncbi:class I SAM-dependent methyltransferase [Fibrella aquatilis]|uniref:Class I SAM-dependent methyltransferase n=1 Tax=Fibrella aquatilis TaxID=2817059 RepID=A0A939JW49_9BACT|nr:class I SAM-dependent methyltransferase [Fibrella aquatilis]MBO0929634.1 class I SAM-dependent methyltransferase [Fibrella aquatilis]
MSFDFIAPVYDRLARLVFGRALRTAHAWCVARIPAGGRVLVLGGGTGHFLPQLLARKPARIVYVEASVAMLRQAQARLSAQPDNLLFHHGTEATLPTEAPFDLILLPFILDLYPESRLSGQFLPRLRSLLTPGGALLICDFDQPQSRWQRAQLWLMIWFFRAVAQIEITQLPNWPVIIQQAGFVEIERAYLRNGQIRMGVYENR